MFEQGPWKPQKGSLANFGEDMLSELESDFFSAPSPANSVLTSDNNVVHLDKALWDASPVLKEHRADGGTYLRLSVPSSSLEALLRVRRNGIPADGGWNAWDLLAATCELELPEMTYECAKVSIGMKAFVRSAYPSQWSPDTVRHCFNMLVNSPLRTREIYNNQIGRISKHCDRNRDIISKAVNLVYQVAAKVNDLRLEHIPVKFYARSVPIVVYKRADILQTAIYDGGSFKPVDVFGRHFKMEPSMITDSLYLKYGSYLLFLHCGCVLKKNLREQSDAVPVLTACKILLTRANFVFAVLDGLPGRNHNCGIIVRWVDDTKFVQVYKTSKKIHCIDFDYDDRVLAMKTDEDHIQTFKFSEENNSLTLLVAKIDPQVDQFFCFKKHWFLLGDMFYREYDGNRPTLQAYEVSHREKLKSPTIHHCFSEDDRVTLKRAAGEFFLDRYGCLQKLRISSTLDKTSLGKVLIEGEQYALSELAM